ncbi:hypothetical protein B0H16DRAFT_1736098 [Mycena metata]|uniref:Uncharacterized protein n=1 Tax=Mycena metata TaxID=1033252 RepID=A0AAD7HR56_9AGAR|nr:hypothetical protein B0H16DRAFT_1736098 [Mycena metata]
MLTVDGKKVEQPYIYQNLRWRSRFPETATFPHEQHNLSEEDVNIDPRKSCIPSVFGALNLGLIVVCTPDIKTNICIPANTTAAPLAASLGLVPDTSCSTGDDADVDCIGDLLREYATKSTQSILVIWNSNGMDDLLENLNLKLAENDDGIDTGEDDEDDLAIYADIILIKNKKKPIIEALMNCTGIDGQAAGSF